MDDLNTLFVAYVETLRDASLLADLDSASLVMKDQPTIRGSYPADLNTAYYEALN
jgi:hypothetical protein